MRFIESMQNLNSSADVRIITDDGGAPHVAHGERCRRCDRPESLVGPLVVVVTRTLASTSSQRVCAECQAEVEAEQGGAPTHPLAETMHCVNAALACPHCHKQRAVANLNAFRRHVAPKLEAITLERHCACPGGPAEHLLGAAVAGGAR